ncbi:acetylornithine deacetylase [Beijerinckia indica]|uniref:Acetylornithine deacetylase (ArgE) n=1 Tax=Beijerinckia indica subsp. indica (strain ATCC 9039 / DSM 1715 / NCIMB 8712) TaxID=395963 RepID=B2IIJ0_BEII9|nr:acetylornithine deacetylase [Beijerinckia indica]ACB94683.1 acetylornithine deacetylase (ArgE) [Beijerinckia indica subsp. indica ATCC 9039]
MVNSQNPDARLGATLDMLECLISFDTESSKSNLPLVAAVEDYLREQAVDYVKVPNAEGDKAALFISIGPKVDGGVVLSGHTDVVPVEGQSWTSDPFTLRREADRVFGRGTCDMKGFDALCLAMIPEFKQARLARPIHILLSYDEEIACTGSLDTIARFGHDLPRPAAVLVGEPTLMQVADAHKSVATYRTTVHGHEAHSSKPYLGASAVEAGCDLVTELYRFAEVLAAEGDPSGRFDPPASTIHVGTIHGGTARNILAKECSFLWEFRGLPGVAQDRALRHLEDYAARVVLPKMTRYAPKASIETLVEVEVPGLAPETGSQAESLALKLARSNRTITVPFATEAGQFQKAEVPTIVCGPGSIDQAHQPDEYIAIAQIEAGIAFMRRLATEMG